ncbi:MAG: EAL domain-containing protein [Gordonibacter sp.]|uniref:bifunctional diguanylate cyclase/phosphodiesterase n=1 Tax=Gordonibacter sp. TaxID=1968902 RepID=UPI00321FE0FE
MQGKRRRTSIAANSFGIALAAFAVACALIGISSFQYYHQLQNTIRDESSGYLQEIARRTGDNVNRIISDNYANLYTIAAIVEKSDTSSYDSISILTEKQKRYWGFEDLVFINEDGKAYNSSGNPIVLNNDDTFTTAIVERRTSISNTQMVDGKERILLSVPLDGLDIAGESMVAIATSFNPSSFDQTLAMESFDGEATSCIIDKNGTVVVRPSNSSGIDTGYNVLTTISDATMEEGDSVEAMKSAMQSDLNGQIAFSVDNKRYYAVYTPVNPENWYLLTFVPSSTVNARSDMLLDMTIMLCGLVTLVSAGLIAFVLFTTSRNKRRLEHLAFVDDVTGGNTVEKFFEIAQDSLSSSSAPQYALAYSNIEKFKVLNDQYGEDDCDDMLRMLYAVIGDNLRDGEAIGRQAADNFVVLVEYEGEVAMRERIATWYASGEQFVAVEPPVWALPVVEFGIFVIDDVNLPFSQMIDRAKLALRECQKALNSKVRYSIYDDAVRHRLLREKELEDKMETALTSGEFQVYLQPKYHLPDRTIGGAEALTRWQSVPEGLIYPDEFIPLFERNGFVVQLDLWVFEEVCRRLRAWIDEGLEPVKVSVNCSRVHLRNANFLGEYCAIARRHRIPRGLVEIELTESVVMEDSQRFISIIDSIHEAGFCCSVDDFGSGYSSLNMIQALPVDTMKLDKIFFRDDEGGDAQRMASVVKSIIGLAKSLSMETVAEGVEKPEQVDMLERFGCDYVQGYVFAEPMPISDFERLAFGKEGGV